MTLTARMLSSPPERRERAFIECILQLYLSYASFLTIVSIS
jgi:hypothetical protein